MKHITIIEDDRELNMGIAYLLIFQDISQKASS